MKIIIGRTVIELSAAEAKEILPFILQITEKANVSGDNQIGVKIVEEKRDIDSLSNFPSEPDLQQSGTNLSEWYQHELHLSVLTANALARAKIFPKELSQMTDKQILWIKNIGRISLEKIREGFNSYLSE